ncbi:MAG: hypothetical protein ABI665_25850 [Vicinamibacterales bacterium]
MRNLMPMALIVGAVLTGPIAVSAQDRVNEPQAKVDAAQAAAPKAAIAQKAAETVEPAKMINLQVEITLTDQLGAAPPTKKIVSLITADGTAGRIRSGADSLPEGVGRRVDVVLNVDALPRLMAGDLIRLNLTIEYRPLKAMVDNKADSTRDSTSLTSLNQSLTVMMTSGKSMIVSQAADPVTDRKIVVEAKATILK